MTFEYGGKTYRSLKAAAEAHGLDYRKVWSRLKAGKSLKEAFSQSDLKKTGQSRSITIDGRVYLSVSEASRYFQVPERTLHSRLERGLTPEQAVELIPFVNQTKKSIVVGDLSFASIAEAANHFGIPLYSVHNRLKRGRSLEDVFRIGKLTRKSVNDVKITIANSEFATLKEACENFNIGYQKARHRLRRGWSIEQVFEIKNAPRNLAKNAPKVIFLEVKHFNLLKK